MALFTSVQDGQFDDGATWGNTSPGVGGVDWPIIGDTISVAGDNVTASGTQACSGGTVGSSGTLSMSTNSYLNVDTGALYFSSGSAAFTAGEGAELEFTSGADWDVTNGTFTANGTANNRCRFHGGSGSRMAAITQTNRTGSFNFFFSDLIFDDFSIGKNNNFPQTPVNLIFDDCVIKAKSGNMVLGGSSYRPDSVRLSRTDLRVVLSTQTISIFTATSHTPGTEKSITDCTFYSEDDGITTASINVNDIDILRPVTKNVKLQQSGSYYGAQYDTGYGHWDDNSEFEADGPFKGKTISTGSRGYRLTNSALWTDQLNAHLISAGVVDSVGAFSNESSDNYIESENTGGVNIHTPASQAFDMVRNVIRGEEINISGSASQTTGISGQRLNVSNNTVLETGNVAAKDTLIVFEGAADPVYTGTVNVDNNLVQNNTTPTGLIRRGEYTGGGTSIQDIDTARNNYATSDALVDDGANGQTVIATESGNNLAYSSANFVDTTRTISKYGQLFHGTGGTIDEMTSEALLINGYDSINETQVVADKSGVDIDDLVAWCRDGYAPQDTTLSTAGYDGGLVGAMPVQSGDPLGPLGTPSLANTPSGIQVICPLVDNATEYRILRDSVEVRGWDSSNTYLDQDVIEGIEYTYTYFARNESETSLESDPASITYEVPEGGVTAIYISDEDETGTSKVLASVSDNGSIIYGYYGLIGYLNNDN